MPVPTDDDLGRPHAEAGDDRFSTQSRRIADRKNSALAQLVRLLARQAAKEFSRAELDRSDALQSDGSGANTTPPNKNGTQNGGAS